MNLLSYKIIVLISYDFIRIKKLNSNILENIFFNYFNKDIFITDKHLNIK